MVASLGPLGIGLTVLFSIFLLVVATELCYFFLHRRQHSLSHRSPAFSFSSAADSDSDEAAATLYTVCWWKKKKKKKMTTKRRQRERLHMAAADKVDCEAIARPFELHDDCLHTVAMAAKLFPSSDLAQNNSDGDEDSDGILDLEGLLGPPRFLFTICEETKEELEDEENDGKSSLPSPTLPPQSSLLKSPPSFLKPPLPLSEPIPSTPPFFTPPSSPFPSCPCSPCLYVGQGDPFSPEAAKAMVIFAAMGSSSSGTSSSSSSSENVTPRNLYPNPNPRHPLDILLEDTTSSSNLSSTPITPLTGMPATEFSHSSEKQPLEKSSSQHSPTGCILDCHYDRIHPVRELESAVVTASSIALSGLPQATSMPWAADMDAAYFLPTNLNSAISGLLLHSTKQWSSRWSDNDSDNDQASSSSQPSSPETPPLHSALSSPFSLSPSICISTGIIQSDSPGTHPVLANHD